MRVPGVWGRGAERQRGVELLYSLKYSATCLIRRGEQYYMSFIENLLLFTAVEEFLNVGEDWTKMLP